MHPALTDAEPLIVAGGARCGTRFVARSYAEHPDTQIHGELHPPAMESAVRFLREVGDIFDGLPEHRAPRARGWQAHRRDLLYTIWATLSKETISPEPTARRTRPARWFGLKTPRHDLYWEFYRDFLGDQVRWVFCIRDFVGHYLSSVAMRPRPIERIAQLYRESIARYEAMRTALGDNVSLFVLNDLRDGGADYLRAVLFDRLRIDIDEATLARIDPERRVNASESAGRQRRHTLTPDEQAFLDTNPDLTDALDRLRKLQAATVPPTG